MKKVVTLIFALVIFFSFSLTASAEEGVTLKATGPTGSIGDTVTVDVSVINNSGIVGIGLMVEYDKTALELVNVENGEIFGSAFITSKDYKVNPYYIGFLDYASTKNYTKTGSLAKLQFKIKSTAQENAATTVKIYSNDAIKYPKNAPVPVFGTTSIIKVTEKDETTSSKPATSSDASSAVSSNTSSLISSTASIKDNTPEAIITSSGYDSKLENDTKPSDLEKVDTTSSEAEILGMGMDTVLLIITAAGIVVAVAAIVVLAIILKKK